MNKQRVLILDRERIDRKLQRMAYQIWEENSNEKALTLVGIEESGMAVAKSLVERLRKISPLNIDLISLKLNKKKLLNEDIKIAEDLNGRTVILVDDVANSGKTLLYGLRPLMNYELKKIMIAVLIDRKHKSYPITPDIIGQSVSTTLLEHIEVVTDGDDITAAYLL
ncbi:MAG: phosphoribosyltransferase family protein [Flavipsychrobacter sp.]|nr:phosphoribosyltransferase family protein [Flavipsychrobacter sp.]